MVEQKLSDVLSGMSQGLQTFLSKKDNTLCKSMSVIHGDQVKEILNTADATMSSSEYLRRLKLSKGITGESCEAFTHADYIMLIFKKNPNKDIKLMDLLKELTDNYKVDVKNPYYSLSKLKEKYHNLQQVKRGVYRYNCSDA